MCNYSLSFLVRGGGHRLCSCGFNRRVTFLVRGGGHRLCSRGFNRRVTYHCKKKGNFSQLFSIVENQKWYNGSIWCFAFNYSASIPPR